jgi:hypothetical protein
MIHRDQASWNELITIGYRRLNSFQITIKLSSVVLFLFLINYGLLGFGLPWSLESFSGLFNQLRIVAFVLTAFFSIAIMSNGLKQNDKRIQVTGNQLILAMVATAISFFSRGAIYSTLLSGDELAYLTNSSFHSIKVGALISDKISPLTQTSISGTFSLQQLSLLGFLVIICCSILMLKLIKSNGETRAAIALTFFVLLRLINDYFFHFSFQHLSGYAISIAPISAVSSSDLVYRIVNTFLFFLVVIVGLGKLVRINQAERLLGAILFLLLFDFFGNFIPILETTMYFVCFGTVVLYRLIQKNQYSFESTLWIAAISVHFRPTNIIWVMLCLGISLITARKKLREILKYLPQIALVAPFIVDSIFRAMVIARGGIYAEADNQYFNTGNAYQITGRSLLQSFSLLEIVIFAGLFIALTISNKFRLPVLLYITLVLFLYIPMIPKSTVGQLKYNYELVLPILLAMVLVLSQTVSKGMAVSSFTVALIVPISIYSNVYNPNEEYVFKTFSSKIIQSPGYIAEPSIHKMSIQTQRAITGENYCFNPSPIYGDGYYLLRSETNFQRQQRRKLESSLVYPSNQAEFLEKNPIINCLIIDSALTKRKYDIYSAGWHRVYNAIDMDFHSVFEIWIKATKGGTRDSQ